MTDNVSNPVLDILKKAGPALAPLLIVAHDHPDPDCIASAWTLAYLAERLHGVRSRIVYGGIIGRMENQMMVRMLHIPLHPVKPQDFERFQNVALLDSQPPFQNNRFPPRRAATIVIDHHPRHPKTQSEHLLIDETAGATATLLGEALLASGLKFPSKIATALVYGIVSETQNLAREVGPRDVGVYQALFARANPQVLSQIQTPPRPRSFFLTLGKAIQNAFIVQHIIGVNLGDVPSQDIVAHMADFLLTHERMRWAFVTGRYDGTLYVSLRTRSRRTHAGRWLHRLACHDRGGLHRRRKRSRAGQLADAGTESDAGVSTQPSRPGNFAG